MKFTSFTGVGLTALALAFGCSSDPDTPPAPPLPKAAPSSPCSLIQDGTWQTVTLGSTTTGSVCVAPGKSLGTANYAVVTNYCDVAGFLASPTSTAGSGCPVVGHEPSYVQPGYSPATRSICCDGCTDALPNANNFFLAPTGITPNLNADGTTAASEKSIMPWVKLADGSTVQVDGWAAVPGGMEGDFQSGIDGDVNWASPYGMSMTWPFSCFDKTVSYADGITQGGVCYQLTGSNGATVLIPVMDVCYGIKGDPQCCENADCSKTSTENCDWCNTSQHAHFDLTNGAYDTICTGSAGHCVLKSVEPVACDFVANP